MWRTHPDPPPSPPPAPGKAGPGGGTPGQAAGAGAQGLTHGTGEPARLPGARSPAPSRRRSRPGRCAGGPALPSPGSCPRRRDALSRPEDEGDGAAGGQQQLQQRWVLRGERDRPRGSARPRRGLGRGGGVSRGGGGGQPQRTPGLIPQPAVGLLCRCSASLGLGLLCLFLEVCIGLGKLPFSPQAPLSLSCVSASSTH